MGRRTSFFMNCSGKSLKELFIEHYSPLRKWYLEFEQSSWDEFNEPWGEKKVLDFLHIMPEIAQPIENYDHKIINELVSEFVGMYDDVGILEERLFEMTGPCMNSSRYDGSTKIVSETNDKELITLWNNIVRGRSIIDNSEFDAFSKDFKIGFLTFPEQQILQAKIHSHFEAFFDPKYLELEKPETMGLELIVRVLDENEEYKSELVSGIE